MFNDMFKYLSRTQFGLIIALLASIAVCVAIAIALSVKKKEAFKIFSVCALAVNGGLLVAIIVVGLVEKYRGAPVENVWSEFGLYILTVALVALIVVLAFVVGKKTEANRTKSLAYAALCLAASFALSYVRLFELPQGGSVTLASLVPLMLYSYMFGVRKGVLAGVIYGFLQFIQGPWFYHPMLFLLDYPIAFGAIGLAGLLHERELLENAKPLQFVLGAIVAVVIRYASHVVSGIFVFGSADPENYSAVAWSFLYNSFAFVDMSIAIAVGVGLFASKSFVSLLNKAKN